MKEKSSIMWVSCSESSKLAVVNHEQGSQDSNNVKTKDESSGVLRETVASTKRPTLRRDSTVKRESQR